MDDGTAKYRRPMPELKELECVVNLDCATRLQAYSRRERQRMGEAKWQRLNAEWK